jgi:hypothetical protein
VLEASPDDAPRIIEAARSLGLAAQQVGTLTAQPTLNWHAADLSEPVDALAWAWLSTLDTL